MVAHLRGNAVAYVALFFALGLGTAWALDRDSVKSKHIKDGSVKAKDVKDGGLSGTEIEDETLTGADVGGLTGADVDEASLGEVPTAADAGTLDGSDSGEFLRNGAAAGGHLTGTYPNPQVDQLPPDIVTPVQLDNIPSVHVESTGPISVSSGASLQILSFNSERYDTAPGMHSTGTNPARLTAPILGDYLITANVAWEASDTDGTRDLRVFRNGDAGNLVVARVNQSGAGTPIQSLSTVVHLFAGDYLEVAVSQDSGSTLDILDAGEYSPEFTMNFVAPVSGP